MARRQTVMLEIDGVADASGDLTIDANPLRTGKLFCVQLVSVLSPAKGKVDVDIRLVRGSTVRGLGHIYITTEDMTYTFPHTVWIPSDWTLRLVWSGSGDGRRCQAWVYGYLMEA